MRKIFQCLCLPRTIYHSQLPRNSMVADDPRRLHQLYGLSREWGLAGLRVGFFYSKDPDVIKAFRAALGCSFTDSDTKWLTERIGNSKTVLFKL